MSGRMKERAAMADMLITGGVVIPVDPERRIIADGAVAIAGSRIVAVGPRTEVTALHPAETVIDARGLAILPGLVDAHAHAGHGLIKTMGGGNWDLWDEACEAAYTVGSTEAFWHAEAQLAALERIRFGVTTGMSLLGGADSIMRTDDPRYGDAHCRGAAAVGGRSIVAVGPTRPPHPRRYARWEGAVRHDSAVSYERQMETCRELVGRWHGAGDGQTRVALLTPTLRPAHGQTMEAGDYRDAVRQTREVHAFALDQGLLFTQDGHARGTIAMAHEMGILGPRTLLSHAIDPTPEEMRLCAESDTRIVHNPSAIAAMLGRCPAPELMDMGVTVCLGSDATAPDRSADMFRHMQQCMHYHRTHFHDPTWLPPGKVLEMCTIDAARALGLEDEVGSLEPGKRADIILVDLRRPHLAPANMPEFRVICFANGNDVHTTIVDGRVVMRDRRALLVDEDAVLDAADAEAEGMIRRLGLAALLRTPRDFWRVTRGRGSNGEP